MFSLLITERRIFNEHGDDSVNARQLIGGNSTGIANLNSVKYTWAPKLFRIMVNNFWLPERVSLVEDKTTIKELTADEMAALKDTLSFLIALDSMQAANLPRLANYITAPEVAALYSVQEYQEVIHSQAYQYILNELFSFTEREEVYNRWKDNPVLLKRNKLIADLYQEFIDAPSTATFKKAIAADFVLESMYFYHGFQFFYQLQARNKAVGIAKEIKYIENDEVCHVSMMKYQIAELFDLTPGSEDATLLKTVLMAAAEQEIEWAHHVYGDRILGMSKKSSEEYIKYLANQRAKIVGLPVLYKGFNKNPYQYLDSSEEEIRENFFESSAVTSYSQSTAVDGWNDF